MNSDEYYSSESYSEPNPIPPNLSKKTNITPSKPSPPLRRPLPNLRRPLPNRSPAQDMAKTTKDKNSPPTPQINSTPSTKKVQIKMEQESESYYESESESSDIGQHNSQAISPIPQPKRNYMKPSPLQNKEIVSESDSNENVNLYGFQNSQIKESNGFQDTDEEPQIVISEQTINSLKPKKVDATSNTLLANSNAQRIDENFNITNSNESFSMVRSDLSESLLSTPQSIIYRVTRTKTQFQHYTYKLFCRDQCLMNASSQNIRKYVEFKKGENFEGKGPLNAYMEISKKRKRFSLFNNGEKNMSVAVSTVKKPLFYERFFTVSLKTDSKSEETVIKTMMPKKRPDGKYSMNFGGKFTKRSIKNAILINDRQQKMIIVRRIGDSQLEIEANNEINNELQIFAFGVISWICPY